MLDTLQQFNLSKNSVAIFSLADDFVGKSVIIYILKLMHKKDYEFPFGEFLLSKQTKQNEFGWIRIPDYEIEESPEFLSEIVRSTIWVSGAKVCLLLHSIYKVMIYK